jgi:hypothetical protein
MTLATMQNNILRYCPLHPDIVSSTIQDAYNQLGMEEWYRLDIMRQVSTAAPYSTGTVAVATTGAVSGTLTTFTSGMVGRFMKVHYSDSLFQIATFTSATSIALTDWPGVVVAAGTAYSIIGTVYTVPTTMRIVYNVVYQTSLGKKTVDFFNRRDPGRTTTGSPTWWAYTGLNSIGYPQIEIYPVPDQVYPLRVYGRAGVSTLGSSDTSLLPETLLEAHALLNCYRILQSKDPKGPWSGRVQEAAEFYKTIYAAARDEDYRLGASRDKVKDYLDTFEGYPPSDTFWAAHDIE